MSYHHYFLVSFSGVRTKYILGVQYLFGVHVVCTILEYTGTYCKSVLVAHMDMHKCLSDTFTSQKNNGGVLKCL